MVRLRSLRAKQLGLGEGGQENENEVYWKKSTRTWEYHRKRSMVRSVVNRVIGCGWLCLAVSAFGCNSLLLKFLMDALFYKLFYSKYCTTKSLIIQSEIGYRFFFGGGGEGGEGVGVRGVGVTLNIDYLDSAFEDTLKAFDDYKNK